LSVQITDSATQQLSTMRFESFPRQPWVLPKILSFRNLESLKKSTGPLSDLVKAAESTKSRKILIRFHGSDVQVQMNKDLTLTDMRVMPEENLFKMKQIGGIRELFNDDGEGDGLSKLINRQLPFIGVDSDDEQMLRLAKEESLMLQWSSSTSSIRERSDSFDFVSVENELNDLPDLEPNIVESKYDDPDANKRKRINSQEEKYSNARLKTENKSDVQMAAESRLDNGRETTPPRMSIDRADVTLVPSGQVTTWYESEIPSNIKKLRGLKSSDAEKFAAAETFSRDVRNRNPSVDVIQDELNLPILGSTHKVVEVANHGLVFRGELHNDGQLIIREPKKLDWLKCMHGQLFSQYGNTFNLDRRANWCWDFTHGVNGNHSRCRMDPCDFCCDLDSLVTMTEVYGAKRDAEKVREYLNANHQRDAEMQTVRGPKWCEQGVSCECNSWFPTLLSFRVHLELRDANTKRCRSESNALNFWRVVRLIADLRESRSVDLELSDSMLTSEYFFRCRMGYFWLVNSRFKRHLLDSFKPSAFIGIITPIDEKPRMT